MQNRNAKKKRKWLKRKGQVWLVDFPQFLPTLFPSKKYKRGMKYRWKILLRDGWSSLKRGYYREGYCYFDA